MTFSLTDHRPISEPSEAPEGSSLKCNFPACRSKTTFNREHDLRRHMDKHVPRQTFDCPAVNCKYRGRKAFYRSDKLIAHLNAGHDEETLFACPVPGCLSNSVLLSRAMLALHMRNHYLPRSYPGEKYRNALSICDENRTCPVETCSQKLVRNLPQARLERIYPSLARGRVLQKIQEHVLQHSEAERIASSTEIAALGFDPLNGYVICPLPSCGMTLPDISAFRLHLIDHTVIDPNHFHDWKNEVSSFVHDASCPWDKWSPLYRYSSNKELELVCPTCGEVSKGSFGDSFTHQLDLLKDPKEFYGCREQILRLYPEFGSHPVFEDVMPIVHRR